MAPPACWVLSHQPMFPLSEEATLRAASPLARGVLRNGSMRSFVRPLRTRRRRRRTSSLPPPPLLPSPPPAPIPEAVGNDDDDDDNDDNGFGGADFGWEDDEFVPPSPPPPPLITSPTPPIPPPPPSTPTIPAAAAASATPNSFAAFQRAQIADQPRLLWAWVTRGMVADLYVSVVEGKWWSELDTGVSEAKSRDFSHIGRIMETELGEKLEGERACASCRNLGEECWAYSKQGAKQVKYAGSTCARCRVAARPGGCSNSTRVPRRPRSPPPPPPRSMLPKGPGGPPPGAGGSSIAV